ncbi:MAG: hypothetical protein ACRD4I_09640, partial [Candidatus Angelobacter sp.]
MEKLATGPAPAFPAHAEQLCHPVIFWMFDLRVCAAKGAAKDAVINSTVTANNERISLAIELSLQLG